MSTLYLLPSYLGQNDYSAVFPDENRKIITSLRYFIVEDLRSARRFLKQVEKAINIDDLTFFTLAKHTKEAERLRLKLNIPSFLEPLKQGENVGVISEALCPAIADPGAERLRQKKEYCSFGTRKGSACG